MRKSSIIGGTILIALGGYGAWCAYKKLNPKCAKDISDDMKKITRNMEKSVEDMM